MGWDNPFSFKGKIGLARFWLILIATSVAAVISDFVFPVARHTVAFGGFSAVGFPVPIEPITAQSWMLFAAHFVIAIPLTWILLAAIVKRLHDHQRSGKWLLIFAGVLVGNMGLDALLSHLGLPQWLAVSVFVITFVPLCLFGIVGMFEVFLFPTRHQNHT